jgi:hypothetical protein
MKPKKGFKKEQSKINEKEVIKMRTSINTWLEKSLESGMISEQQIIVVYDKNNNIEYLGKADFAPLTLWDDFKTAVVVGNELHINERQYETTEQETTEQETTEQETTEQETTEQETTEQETTEKAFTLSEFVDKVWDYPKSEHETANHRKTTSVIWLA